MASGEQQQNNNLNNYSSSSSINQRSRSHSLEEKEQNENVKSNSSMSAENRRYSNPTNILNVRIFCKKIFLYKEKNNNIFKF